MEYWPKEPESLVGELEVQQSAQQYDYDVHQDLSSEVIAPNQFGGIENGGSERDP